MRTAALALPGALVAFACACACEAVPTLTFERADAMTDAAADATDADGAPGPASDADVDGGCPGPDPPQAAFVCCGPVACEGQCAGQCDACTTKCTAPGDICCAKTNNVLCLPAGSICH